MDIEEINNSISKIKSEVFENPEADKIIEDNKKVLNFLYYDGTTLDIIPKLPDQFLLLGILHYYGFKNIERDLNKAREYLEKITKDSITKDYLLGKIYSNSSLKCHSLKKACEHYKKVIAKGENSVKYEYAQMCEKLNDNIYNVNEAIKYYKELTDIPEVCIKLVHYIKLGMIKASNEEIIELLRKSVDIQENSETIYELVRSLPEEQRSEKISLLKRAVELGNFLAIIDLCELLIKSHEDFREIENYYKLAIENGIYMAYYKLGQLYLNNNYENVNKQMAVDYFKKAAEHNIALAEIELIKLKNQ